jgi:predicted nucleic acid-binding Zn ribbon protein
MERLDVTAVRALRAALDTQPLTEGKVRFAWALAAGPTLARSATVTWADGVLSVRAKSQAWRQELSRSRAVLLDRIAGILGPDAVRTIVVSRDSQDADSSKRDHQSHRER